MDLRLSGAGGQISLDDFVFHPAMGRRVRFRKGGFGMVQPQSA
jgi:hypothetical protein